MDGTRAASPSSFGWAGPVHCKFPASQEVRTLLVARKQLLGKLLDVEFSIRGILRGFGLRMGVATRNGFEARVSEQCVGQAMLEQIVEAMLAARAAMWKEYSKLRKAMLVIVRRDEISWRLMSVPGVGPLVAITFKTAIDNPARIRKSKAVGALLALTPRKYHSGETDVTGALETPGVAVSAQGAIIADARMRTSAPSIFAADCTDLPTIRLRRRGGWDPRGDQHDGRGSRPQSDRNAGRGVHRATGCDRGLQRGGGPSRRH